jgi:pimeloyl-ACP methyl ester carboxylesterase
MPHGSIDAGVLRVGYEEHGDPSGKAVVLLHGFPYDTHAYDGVAPLLAAEGLRVIVPSLRGYGATRFLSDATPRSGQQAALGADLLALLDALRIDEAVVAGYDWGGRAACVVAALWPQRVRGLVSVNGYNVQDIAHSAKPAAPDQEYRLWYQYYFHGERGRSGLAANRRELCRLLWRLWSPGWAFTDADFDRSAPSFDNPDFVDVVIHSYRHRFALVAGDPALEEIELRLAPSRRSTCRRSRWTATPTACRAATRRRPGASSHGTSIAPSVAAWATTCLRRHRRHSRRRCATSTDGAAADPQRVTRAALIGTSTMIAASSQNAVGRLVSRETKPTAAGPTSMPA